MWARWAQPLAVVAQLITCHLNSRLSCCPTYCQEMEGSLELEALRLRRELAAVKMEAARMAAKRDEMRHTVNELHKQLMGEARIALRRNKGSLMFT